MDWKGEASRAQAGDGEAFVRLVEGLTPTLFRFARRFAADVPGAEDIVQETWIRAHGALERYDPARPFLPWLYRIASNLAISCARRRRRRPQVALQDGDARACAGAGGAAVLAAREGQEAVRAAVDALPPIYRAVCVLYYLQEMDLGDVAEALAIPVGTAKIRLYRARALLRGRLGALVEAAGIGSGPASNGSAGVSA